MLNHGSGVVLACAVADIKNISGKTEETPMIMDTTLNINNFFSGFMFYHHPNRWVNAIYNSPRRTETFSQRTGIKNAAKIYLH
jgi:hypothetical protein